MSSADAATPTSQGICCAKFCGCGYGKQHISLLILVAICFSGTGFAQSAPPKARAESADGLQTRWNGPGAQDYGLVTA
jgi:hypothetical protein